MRGLPRLSPTKGESGQGIPLFRGTVRWPSFPDRKRSYLGYVFQLDDVSQVLIDALAGGFNHTIFDDGRDAMLASPTQHRIPALT